MFTTVSTTDTATGQIGLFMSWGIAAHAAEMQHRLLEEFVSINGTRQSTSSAADEEALVMAFKVPTMIPPHFNVGNTGTRVVLPPNVRELFNPDQEQVLVVTAYKAGNPQFLGGNRLQSLVQIELLELLPGGETKAMKVQGLEEPIQFTLPIAYEPGLACSYWDEGEDRWLTGGVSLGEGNKAGFPMVCATTHLTVFAAMAMKVMECTQFSIFAPETASAIFQSGWLRQWGTFAVWALLVVCLAAFMRAAVTDKHHARQGWSAQSLLIAARPRPVPAEEGPVCGCGGDKANEQIRDERYVGLLEQSLLAMADSAMGWSKTVKMIMNRWRGFRMPRASLYQLLLEVAQALLLLSTRHGVAASLQLSPAVVAYVADKEVLTNFLEVQRAGGGPEDRVVAMQTLVTDRVSEAISNLSSWYSAGKLGVRIFAAQNPIGSLSKLDVFTPSKLRCLLFTAKVFVSLALTCSFLQVSACKDEEVGAGSLAILVMLSLLLAWMLVASLKSLRTQSFVQVDFARCGASRAHLQNWRSQDRIAAALAALATAWGLFCALAFLASAGSGGQQAVVRAVMMLIVAEFIMFPLLPAFVWPLSGRAIFECLMKVHKVKHDDFVHAMLIRALGLVTC